MIWPFRKRSSRADGLEGLLPDLIDVAAEKWLEFSRTSGYSQAGPLKGKIAFFSVPAIRGLKENIRELRDTSDSMLVHVIALGIVKSGTHTEAEVEEALGRKLSGPND